ncbi:MAG: PDZ domain-containing protein [Deltaproteobacteria bacterium]|nr:PDZ domain-containing protein [Deltaproteobacteria bacterium]
MKRSYLAKVTILVTSVAAALFLTLYRPSPEGLIPFGVGQAEVRAAPGSPSGKGGSSYSLGTLKIINVTLQKIHDNYVDPTRIDSKSMLLASLESVQRNVAEVLIEPSPAKSEVTVQVNDKRQSFQIADVDSPWRLHSKLREIFRFIQVNMNPSSDPAQIEYAAANGLLSTLDPHSVLLDPEQAREMDINTTGKFGGIGIEIGIRKRKLTVLRLISNDTPAARAGLMGGDHIAKINNEPTANLTLTEAMNRLRGDPLTKVVVTVERRGVAGTKEYPITRDEIRVSSVEGRMLKGSAGYLRIKSFSSSTERDLRRTMEELRKQGAKAWVLDLRENPGGLLDQAIKVADLFIDSGTIVTTVGYAGKQREEKRARLAGTDTQSPLVVLVNGGSASASEIVAGALKNMNRAIIVGQTTFGKGSVQVLFDNDDGSKLKLTIAQYLTPGDVSIQSIGVAPDIELVPVRIPDKLAGWKDFVRLRGKTRQMREADLDAHLTSKNVRTGDKPAESLKYFYVPPPGSPLLADDDEEEGPEDEEAPLPTDRFVEDFQIQFARDYALQGSTKRSDMLPRSKGFVQKRRAEEEEKISAALAKLGIDWTVGPKTSGTKLVASFTTDRDGNKVLAGEAIAVTGVVTNHGTAPAYRVHGYMKSDDYSFEDTELVFGRIDPGASRSFTAYIKVPMSAATRVDEIDMVFSEAGGAKVGAQPLKVVVDGQKRPLFAYTYQLIDEKAGNGDGLLQAGESHRLHVTVKNLGAGKSHRTTAMLRNASGDGVAVNMGRFEFDQIPAGETKTIDFTFDMKKEFAQKELVLELMVFDSTLHESLTEKLKFPVRSASAGPQAITGFAKVTRKEGVVIREGAADDSAMIGNARRGGVFKVTGRDGTWTRIELESGRPGFIPTSALAQVGSGPSAGAFTPSWQVTPPTIAVNIPSLETSGDKWSLSGVAQDDNHVEDVFVLVSNREAKVDGKKVYYRSNRGGRSKQRLDFASEIPVWPGNNMITVVARENNDVKTMQTLFVYRKGGQEGPESAAAPAPAVK